jgi:GT2 family glycosyltransferase
VRRTVLNALGGFDERFFYHFEETDLCCRIRNAGYRILYFPGAVITHLGGQSVGRFPIRFALETYRSRYRYFYKHWGPSGAARVRWINLLELAIRYCGYSVQRLVSSSEPLQNRLKLYRVALRWNWGIDTARFIASGDEPELGYAPLAPAPRMVE